MLIKGIYDIEGRINGILLFCFLCNKFFIFSNDLSSNPWRSEGIDIKLFFAFSKCFLRDILFNFGSFVL